MGNIVIDGVVVAESKHYSALLWHMQSWWKCYNCVIPWFKAGSNLRGSLINFWFFVSKIVILYANENINLGEEC